MYLSLLNSRERGYGSEKDSLSNTSLSLSLSALYKVSIFEILLRRNFGSNSFLFKQGGGGGNYIIPWEISASFPKLSFIYESRLVELKAASLLFYFNLHHEYLQCSNLANYYNYYCGPTLYVFCFGLGGQKASELQSSRGRTRRTLHLIFWSRNSSSQVFFGVSWSRLGNSYMYSLYDVLFLLLLFWYWEMNHSFPVKLAFWPLNPIAILPTCLISGLHRNKRLFLGDFEWESLNES